MLEGNRTLALKRHHQLHECFLYMKAYKDASRAKVLPSNMLLCPLNDLLEATKDRSSEMAKKGSLPNGYLQKFVP